MIDSHRIDAGCKANAPREVRERLEWSPGFYTAPSFLPIVGYYFLRTALARSDAWVLVMKADSVFEKGWNPYRHAHTKNFWIWWRYT